MNITTRTACTAIALLLVFGVGFTSFAVVKPVKKVRVLTKAEKQLVGTYRCRSYNVSGGGSGNCRLAPPIVLKADGTYSVSSEKGTYVVRGSTVVLSKSKLRGPGKILDDGVHIRFEYDYKKWHHVVTYLKESQSPSPSSSKKQPYEAPSEVSVQITLEYPAKDSALNSIATIELVPEGGDVKKADYKPTALAIWDGENRVTASFHKELGKPRTGLKYTIYANTGFSTKPVGTLDLTKATTQIVATIKVDSLGTSGQAEAVQKEIKPSAAPLVVVEVDLVYPEKNSSLGSIQFIVLVPEGEDPMTAVYKPMALAIWDGERTVSASFHKESNQVRTGARYVVYADWGRETIKSGVLDITATETGPIKKSFQTTISGL